MELAGGEYREDVQLQEGPDCGATSCDSSTTSDFRPQLHQLPFAEQRELQAGWIAHSMVSSMLSPHSGWHGLPVDPSGDLVARTSFPEQSLTGPITDYCEGIEVFDPTRHAGDLSIVVKDGVGFGYVVIYYKGKNVAVLLHPHVAGTLEINKVFTIDNSANADLEDVLEARLVPGYGQTAI